MQDNTLPTMHVLTEQETLAIDGGSISDWFWYGVGYVSGSFNRLAKECGCDPSLAMT